MTIAVPVGLLLAVVGVVLGVVIAFKSANPLEGSAIAVISALLGVLILLVGILINANLDAEARTGSR